MKLSQQQKPQRELTQQVLRFVCSLLRDLHPRDFAVELWDGTLWPQEDKQFHRFTWRINHPAAMRKVAFSPTPEVALAEAYMCGDFDIVGDLTAAFRLADYLIQKDWNVRERAHLLGKMLTLPSASRDHKTCRPIRLAGPLHSRGRDREAIHYHYDVSNDFYALWLDHNMIYSCAYFAAPDEDIDTAQTRKLDYVCRKLSLSRGERFLDIGCGWGGLILHAAREYGVRAEGITLSEKQFELAKERIQNLGMSQQCQVRLLDYRDLEEAGAYDKVASVGMVEHVGSAELPDYFHQVFRLLRPGGIFLNAGIGRPEGPRPVDGRSAFTDFYIFPDGELVSIATLLSQAELAGFEVHQVENLREHYELTVLQWLRRLEARAEEAKRLVGEMRYRMWRLYLAGSAYYFHKAWLHLYHNVLLKTAHDDGRSPLVRTNWRDTPRGQAVPTQPGNPGRNRTDEELAQG